MDRRRFTIRGIDDYEQALRQIGEYSDENTDDSSEVDSDVDAPDSDISNCFYVWHHNVEYWRV